MCRKSTKSSNSKRKKKSALQNSFLFRDVYAQEVRLKLNGETSISSTPGTVLSFIARIIIALLIFERFMSLNSFNRFTITEYDSKIEFTKGAYTTDDLNFESNRLELMIGFDRMVPPEIGRFNFGLLQVDEDGIVQGLDPIDSVNCKRPNELNLKQEGITFAERELGKTYEDDFVL